CNWLSAWLVKRRNLNLLQSCGPTRVGGTLLEFKGMPSRLFWAIKRIELLNTACCTASSMSCTALSYVPRCWTTMPLVGHQPLLVLRDRCRFLNTLLYGVAPGSG